jgi:hypothetical protein
MKRVLLIGIILAILILAMPQGVLAIDTAIVNANVKDVITFDVGNNFISPWLLTTGQINSQTSGVDLFITSNSRYDVNVFGTNGGKLTDPASGGLQLAKQLEIKNAADAWAFIPGTSLNIVKNHAATVSGGEHILKDFQQDVAWADQHLVGSTYQITLTFTVVPTV